MDSQVSDKIPPRQLRRSTRQSVSASAHAVKYEPTPRGPLKRAKKPSKPQSESSAVNGTNDNDSDDEDSPKKKTRLEAGDILAGGEGHATPKDETEPMETHEESEGQEDENVPFKYFKKTPIIPSDSFGHVHLKPPVVLIGERCSVSHLGSERIKTQVEQPKKTKHATPTTPSKSPPAPVPVTSIDDYHRKMEMKANIPENSKGNYYVQRNYTKPVITTTRRRTTDFSSQKTDKNQEAKKPAVSRQKAQVSSKGFFTYFWQLVLLLLLIAGLFLAVRYPPTVLRTKDSSADSSRSVNLGLFIEKLPRVALRFPNQRPELWKRSQIHLQRHLDLSHPTEPVSMILTAGLRAQKTLLCLAHNIASAFSSALNSSVVTIDGAGLSNLDSDQVKMSIDSQLKGAFGGDRLAAVVHRFEELPPGSTLIFYRYCDHETAAYKRAFILFTVLLSEDDLSTQQSLKEVEEMVRDHIEERFVGNETAFNKMDADKFSGLWSRIAHLVLPVAYEAEIEQRGC